MTTNPHLRTFVALLAIAMLVVACGDGDTGSSQGAASQGAEESMGAESMAPESQAASGSYRIGYSNGGGVGNGFREEQVCTAQAEALA